MIVGEWKQASEQIDKMIKNLFYIKGNERSPIPFVELPYWNHTMTTVSFTNQIKTDLEKIKTMIDVGVMLLKDWTFEK